MIAASAQGQQKEKVNWFFGNKAGLTWNKTQTVNGLSGLPTPLSGSQMNTGEGCFVLSDPNGILLLYSDGITIWNGEHEVVTTDLSGNKSSAQSGIIMPYPGRPGLYFVFAISLNYDYISLTGEDKGNRLTYTVVDISQKTPGGNGYGVIYGNYRDVPMAGTSGILGESISAVRHTNGKDFWLVAIGKGTTTYMNAWLINSGGVPTNPTNKTSMGSSSIEYANANGYLRFSPSGKYYIWPEHTSSKVFLGQFDPGTGKCLNNKILDDYNMGFYGVEFSPSGKNLFLSSSFRLRVYQTSVLFNASSPNNASKKEFEMPAGKASEALQTGPDGRIYGSLQASADEMIVIDKVDEYNNYSVNFIKGLFTQGSNSRSGLPNFLSGTVHAWYYVSIEGKNVLCQDIAESFTVNLSNITGVGKICWKFGDGTAPVEYSNVTQSNQSHIYKQSGDYTIDVEILDTSGNVITKASKNVEVNTCTPPLPVSIPVNPHLRGYYGS